MQFVVGLFKKDQQQSRESCRLLSPTGGIVVKCNIQCALRCLQQGSFCEGFIFSSSSKLCKFVGNSGTLSSGCVGEYYITV